MAVKEVPRGEVYDHVTLSREAMEPDEIAPYSLAHLKMATIAFREDRPTLDQMHYVDLRITLRLAYKEIEELNGSDKYGFFADPEKRSEYRQQEISDVVIFLLDIYNYTAEYDGNYIFPDENAISARAQEIAAEYGVEAVSTSGTFRFAKPPEQISENHFLDLRNRLNVVASVINPDNYLEWMALSPNEKLEKLNAMMALCYVMHYMLGVNPIRAALEKVARNNLRYPVEEMQEGFADILEKYDLNDDQKLALCNVRYNAAIDRCKIMFDGAENKEKERPQTGTRDFYAPVYARPIIEAMANQLKNGRVYGELAINPKGHEPVQIY